MEPSRWAGLGSDGPLGHKPWAEGLAVVQAGPRETPNITSVLPLSPDSVDSHSKVPTSVYPRFCGSRALARTSYEGRGGPLLV